MKKLLGLLAVAPMAIAACGGSSFDSKTAFEGTAYAAVHGDTILSGEQTVASGTTFSTADIAGDTCDTVTETELEGVVEGLYDDNNYDLTDVGSGITTVEDSTDATVCNISGTYTLTPTDLTSTFAGLGMATAGVNAANEITELTIDESKWKDLQSGESHVANAKARVYTVREKFDATKMDANGYRELTKAEADAFETTFTGEGYVMEWKTTDAGYMFDLWNPTIEAMIDHMIGMTLAEAKEFATDLEATDNGGSDYLEGITGASEGMVHDYHYAKMAILAVEKAIEASKA